MRTKSEKTKNNAQTKYNYLCQNNTFHKQNVKKKERIIYMSLVNLSKEQDEILKFLERYGCVDITQLYIILQPYTKDAIDRMIDMLVKVRKITIIDGHVVAPYGEKSIDLGAISCIWAMLKVCNNGDEILNSFNAAEPAFAFMTVENKDSYIFVNVKSDETYKIRAIQEKVAKSFKSKHFKDTYIFVTTDENVRSIIKDIDFENTIYVAILDYDRKTRVPEIKLLKKKPA